MYATTNTVLSPTALKRLRDEDMQLSVTAPDHLRLYRDQLLDDYTKEQLLNLLARKQRELEMVHMALSNATSDARNMWQLIRRMHDLVLIFDHQGIITFVSPSCWRMLGYAPSEMYDKPLFSFLDPATYDSVESDVARIVHAQRHFLPQSQGFSITFHAIAKGGQIVLLEGMGQAWSKQDSIEFLFNCRDRAITDKCAWQPDGSSSDSTLSTVGMYTSRKRTRKAVADTQETDGTSSTRLSTRPVSPPVPGLPGSSKG